MTHILGNDESITLKDTDGQTSIVPWERIQRMMAFKRDVFSHDVVCLLIEDRDQHTFELNETMPGWSEFVAGLEVHLPTAKPYAAWLGNVAFPAFAVSAVEIYIRPEDKE